MRRTTTAVVALFATACTSTDLLAPPVQPPPDATGTGAPGAVATAGAGRLRLPGRQAGETFSPGRRIADISFGSGPGQLGVLDPEEGSSGAAAGPTPGGEPTGSAVAADDPAAEDQGGRGRGDPGDALGPTAIAVDGSGRILVVDLVNRRIVRFAPDGAFDATLPLVEGQSPVDVAASADGSFAVYFLDPNEEKVALYDPYGMVLAITDLNPGLVPPSALFVPAPGEVLVEFDDLRTHAVISGGAPVPRDRQLEVARSGLPLADGSASGTLVDDLTGVVRRYDAEGVLAAEAVVESDVPMVAMSFLQPTAEGGVVAVFLRQQANEEGTVEVNEYVAARLSPALGAPAFERFAPAVERTLFRDVAVGPDGTLYQLVESLQGATLVAHSTVAP